VAEIFMVKYYNTSLSMIGIRRFRELMEQEMARGSCCNLARLTAVALYQYNIAHRIPLFTSRLRSGL
jgi:hypothetical protein